MRYWFKKIAPVPEPELIDPLSQMFFEYTGITCCQEERCGRIEADDVESAAAKVEQLGLTVVSLKIQGEN